MGVGEGLGGGPAGKGLARRWQEAAAFVCGGGEYGNEGRANVQAWYGVMSQRAGGGKPPPAPGRRGGRQLGVCGVAGWIAVRHRHGLEGKNGSTAAPQGARRGDWWAGLATKRVIGQRQAMWLRLK